MSITRAGAPGSRLWLSVAIAIIALSAALIMAGTAAAQATPDTDGDGLNNKNDPFAIDATNGRNTPLPVSLPFSGPQGGIDNLGFTGLMTNASNVYTELFDANNVGIAGGNLTINAVPDGDAVDGTQMYAFQLGVDADPANANCFTVHARVTEPFEGRTPTELQSMGVFVGTGDQDNYAKLVVTGAYGEGIESHGEIAKAQYHTVFGEDLPGPDYVDLYLNVNPDANTVLPAYSATRNGVTGEVQALSGPIDVPSTWFTAGDRGLAIGIISTSYNRDLPGTPFPASWDLLNAATTCVTPDVGAPAVPGGGGSASDTNPPRLSRLRMIPSTIRTNGRVSKRGGRVRVRVSERASVRLKFAKRRANGTYRLLKGKKVQIVPEGTSRIRFNGKLRGRWLASGSYRVIAAATDASGNRSKVKQKSFRVVRP